MNIITPINQLGYGVTGLNIVKSLNSIIDNVALWTIGNPQITNQEDANVIQKCLRNAVVPDFDAACIRIWHQHDMSQFVGRGLRIGFPIFELDEFNDQEKHHLNSLDKIFVCSHWAKEVCENNLTVSKENIHVVPLGVDNNIFKPCEKNNKSTTIFFNCGKWEVRKGHDILPEIFSRSFTENDDVELWLMCENPFLSEQEKNSWKKLYTDSKLGYKVRFIDRKDTQKEVYNIMQRIDCGVFPSKAEGWNLEILELMACGKHIITTNYSAHTEFCNSENSKLINIQNKEIASDNKWFVKNIGRWAKFDEEAVEQCIAHMRDIHEQKQNQSLDVNYAGIKTAEEFSWTNSARKIISYV